MRSLDKLDFYGKKRPQRVKQRPQINRQQFFDTEASYQSRENAYVGTPLMDSIMLEIRTHLEEAKEDITILQR